MTMARLPSPLNLLSQLTFDAVLTVDDDRRYLTTNARGATLLGTSREDLLERAIDDLTSPQFHSMLPDLWSALERDGSLRGAYEVKRGDGSVGMIEFAARRDLFEGQHLIVARDLPRSGGASRAGFALVDPRTGDISAASPECCRLVGRSEAELLATGLRVFGGARGRDEMMRRIRAIAAGEQGSSTFRCAVVRPQGATQWVSVTLRPVFGAGSRPIRILLETIPMLKPAPATGDLTAREREVLQAAADGGTAATIAEILVVSPGTVRTHLRNIYAKLNARDRAAAVAEGLRRGLID